MVLLNWLVGVTAKLDLAISDVSNLFVELELPDLVKKNNNWRGQLVLKNTANNIVYCRNIQRNTCHQRYMKKGE